MEIPIFDFIKPIFLRLRLNIGGMCICLMPFLFSSCFLVKIPVEATLPPLTDTINVYHFIVSKTNIADSATSASFVSESKKAYDWIRKEAAFYGQKLYFKEQWVNNENPARRNTFLHKLPSRSLKRLAVKSRFKIVTQKRTRHQKQRVEKLSWRKRLYESMVKQVDDTSIAWMLKRASLNYSAPDNELIVVHILKARRSWINGFYISGETFIGKNKSRTIAHESLHHLGATDLYIHKFWFGKRRRTVVREMKQEIMNNALPRNQDCSAYVVSSYSAWTMGWTSKVESEFVPIQKENLMARINFLICLMLF